MLPCQVDFLNVVGSDRIDGGRHFLSLSVIRPLITILTIIHFPNSIKYK